MSGVDQLLERTRLLLPAALLVIAAAVQTYASPTLLLVATAALSGLALGVFLQLLLRAVAVLLGQSERHRRLDRVDPRIEREIERRLAEASEAGKKRKKKRGGRR